MTINMRTKKETKTEILKVRLTKEQKEKLKNKADAESENLSSFILRIALHENFNPSLPFPQIIETDNFINEIYHKIKNCNDETLKQDILSLYEKYIPSYRMEE